MLIPVHELASTRVIISTHRPLVIVSPDPTRWHAEINDDAVAAFIPGVIQGGTQFHCGVEAKAPGDTPVHLSDGAGARVTFHVVVEQ